MPALVPTISKSLLKATQVAVVFLFPKFLQISSISLTSLVTVLGKLFDKAS